MKEVIMYQSEDDIYFSEKISCEEYEKCVFKLKEIVDKYIGLTYPEGNTEYKKYGISTLMEFAYALNNFLLEELPELNDDRLFTRAITYLNKAELNNGIRIIINFLSMLLEKYYKNCVNVYYKLYFCRLEHRLKDFIDFDEGVEYGTSGMNTMYRGRFQSYLEWREEELEANKEGYTTIR
jgi:hypothetical protein